MHNQNYDSAPQSASFRRSDLVAAHIAMPSTGKRCHYTSLMIYYIDTNIIK